MRFCEPLLATVITNPTNRDLKYTWLGGSGTFVKKGSTVTVPYDIYTAANSGQRAQLGEAIRSKMVIISYKSRMETTKVSSIPSDVVHGDTEEIAKSPAVEEPPVAETAPVAPEQKPERTEIINAVEKKEDESPLQSGEDLVQKATGQKTIGMREAMGWDEPKTDDTREEQVVEDIKMEDALTENVGDPLAKLAAEAEKTALKEKQEADLAEAKAKAATTAADEEAAKAAKEKAEAEEAEKKAAEAKEKAEKTKRSAAAKKAAATRKKNQAAKKKK